MVNRLYNKQVSPKGYMKGGRVKKMGGGMMNKGVKIPAQLKKFVMAKKKKAKMKKDK